MLGYVWGVRMLMLVACLFAAGLDAGRVPGFDRWVWVHGYVIMGALFAVWMVTRYDVILTTFFGMLFVAQIVRAGAWIILNGSYAGGAINLIVAILLVDFVHNRREEKLTL